MTTLPLYPEDEAYEAILNRMLSKIPNDYDKTEGSMLYDILAPVAAEVAQLVIKAQMVLERGFAQTTFGEYLTLRAEESGVIRRPAVSARGIVTFTGLEGTPIPKGRVVSTGSTATVPAILFTTDVDVVVPVQGSVDVPITAVDAGTSGNVAAGTITYLAEPIAGITSVTNAAATSGGEPEESDASLLNRYLIAVRSPGTSGNRADYVNWAMEVPGVGAARVIPLWDGDNTVKVVILDEEKQPASPELVAEVQTALDPGTTGLGDGKAPISAFVTVATATALDINIAVTVERSVGYTQDQVLENIQANLTRYFQDIAFIEGIVSYARVGAAILESEGVEDYAGLTMNGGSVNISIDDEEVAVLGAVNLT